MISYLSASWVYPVSSEPVKDGVIAVDEQGEILAVYRPEEIREKQITPTRYDQGVLVPGLINTHCHLELSHLLGAIPEHTGLPEFVREVMQHRTAGEAEISAAMTGADQQMRNNGIVAVGDISNHIASREVKLASPLYYHTFVETMSFNPEKAGEMIDRAKQIKSAFFPLNATVVPHAPYSVSAALFAAIRDISGGAGDVLSIHNQETADENLFFEAKSGHFLNLYDFLGLDISFFRATGRSSLQSYLPQLPAAPSTLLVHNTFTSADDIAFAQGIHPRLFWCLCPNANRYIENRLPDVQQLIAAGATITLGTDSLASNHQLSILSEMYTLQQEKGIAFEELLSWATINGARFLQIDAIYGSFEAGKRPGINLLQLDKGKLSRDSRVTRLI